MTRLFFILLKACYKDVLQSNELLTLSGLESYILIAINGKVFSKFYLSFKQNLNAKIPFHCLQNISAVQSCLFYSFISFQLILLRYLIQKVASREGCTFMHSSATKNERQTKVFENGCYFSLYIIIIIIIIYHIL